MPTYEYECPSGHTFELVQRITGRAGAKCPECGKRAVRRISGGAALIFKGSGFYITDYGKDGKGPRKEADAAAPKPEAAETPKAETPKSDPPKAEGPAPAPKRESGFKPSKLPRKKADP